MMNLLLGGVCILIPIIGPIVVLGWAITGFWGRQDEAFETFPAFDFSNFGKYLERGLWPFLVTFVASLVFIPVGWILAIPVMLLAGFSAQGHNNNAAGCMAVFVTLLIVLFFAIMLLAMLFVIVPLKIRASLTQDFVKSFDLRFIRRFIALTWVEILISSLFIMVASIVLWCIGALVFCVGVYFALVVIYFSWTHLYKQLYALYLSRGGEPVPLSPKLAT